MKFGLVTLMTLASLAAGLSTPALAAGDSYTLVPRSVIEAGPIASGTEWYAGPQAQYQFFKKVCPTVMHSPDQYTPSIVRFCR